MKGLDEICCDKEPSDIRAILHGTTICVNAVIMRKGAKTALIVTKGFGDLLEMGKKDRSPDLYDLFYVRPAPLVPRTLTFELDERTDKSGEVLKPLSETGLKQLAGMLRESGVDAVAVSLLHSYANPEHELIAKKILSANLPDTAICISSEVDSQIREYQRTSTTVMNAYIMPLARSYFSGLDWKIKERGIATDIQIMQANGGLTSIDGALQRPIDTLFSTHSGALSLGEALGAALEEPNLVVIDMGGTSFDIGFIRNGIPDQSSETIVAGQPARISMIESFSIGAGGGSIAWIDDGGALRVGPESAGADPGPVCYDRGGERLTVTDANLVLGRLSDDRLLGGRVHITVSKARDALRTQIADPLGLPLEQAALSVIEVVNSRMVEEIRLHLIQKGYDPRDFALFALGGAGPLHAAEIARQLEFSKVIVPRYPGVASSIGFLFANYRHDLVLTYLRELGGIASSELDEGFSLLEERVEQLFNLDGIPADEIHKRYQMDMRYLGQGYHITVPLEKAPPVNIGEVARKFHAEHEEVYGHSAPNETVQVVNLRLCGEGIVPKPRIEMDEQNSIVLQPIANGKSRKVYFGGEHGWMECKILMRGDLPPGPSVDGPCIVEQMDTTALILPDQRVKIDRLRNLVISDNDK